MAAREGSGGAVRVVKEEDEEMDALVVVVEEEEEEWFQKGLDPAVGISGKGDSEEEEEGVSDDDLAAEVCVSLYVCERECVSLSLYLSLSFFFILSFFFFQLVFAPNLCSPARERSMCSSG